MKKKIVYLTGTRADFGKQKSLIRVTDSSELFDTFIWVTGMHLNEKYGYTVDEIYRSNFNNGNIYKFINHSDFDTMDLILAKTIEGFSSFIKKIKPDLIVVHGDRVEALAGAIVGSLNNILVAHIEGGELSGTIDGSIRHAVSKMSHLHFVSNKEAHDRLLQLGEKKESVFLIGSPDIDAMESDELPSIQDVKEHYEINFDAYAILLFHPVTTEYNYIKSQVQHLVDAIIEANDNFVIISPNNDHGAEFIFSEYKRFEKNYRFRIFPSLRFEYFLVLLKHAKYVIGNSSASIREAPHYGVPTINIGSRQNQRTLSKQIINCRHDKKDILDSITIAASMKVVPEKNFGDGNSSQRYYNILQSNSFWETSQQKIFMEHR